jgi:hypothetical protein
MRSCRLVAVRNVEGREFMWEWRSTVGERRSARRFALFHDCLEDARGRGFYVVLERPTGEMAPHRYSLAPQ